MLPSLVWRKCSAPSADHLMPVNSAGLCPDFKDIITFR